MSRRFHGRFGGNSSEAYQRQLAAPVHKWKKAWVSPTGLQPESSYKICKWVRVDAAADEGSPAPDEDEEMEDGDEGEEGEGDDGAEDGGEDAEIVESQPGAEVKEDGAVPAPAPAEAAVDGEKEAMATAIVIDEPETALPTEMPSTIPTPPVPSPAPAAAPSVAAPIEAEASPRPPTPPLPAPATEAEAVPPISHPLPANAIEIHNTAPHTTELGAGDLAGVGGVELTHGEIAAVPVAAVEAEGSAMEVDQESQPSAAEAASAEVVDVEKGQAPEVDEGLVMGDAEPVRQEFVVEGEDKPREVDV